MFDKRLEDCDAEQTKEALLMIEVTGRCGGWRAELRSWRCLTGRAHWAATVLLDRLEMGNHYEVERDMIGGGNIDRQTEF